MCVDARNWFSVEPPGYWLISWDVSEHPLALIRTRSRHILKSFLVFAMHMVARKEMYNIRVVSF